MKKDSFVDQSSEILDLIYAKEDSICDEIKEIEGFLRKVPSINCGIVVVDDDVTISIREKRVFFITEKREGNFIEMPIEIRLKYGKYLNEIKNMIVRELEKLI